MAAQPGASSSSANRLQGKVVLLANAGTDIGKATAVVSDKPFLFKIKHHSPLGSFMQACVRAGANVVAVGREYAKIDAVRAAVAKELGISPTAYAELAKRKLTTNLASARVCWINRIVGALCSFIYIIVPYFIYTGIITVSGTDLSSMQAAEQLVRDHGTVNVVVNCGTG